jgi:hypothetical protein
LLMYVLCGSRRENAPNLSLSSRQANMTPPIRAEQPTLLLLKLIWVMATSFPILVHI